MLLCFYSPVHCGERHNSMGLILHRRDNMGLINCSECKKEISDTAKTCPNCGFVNKKKSKSLLYIGCGLLSLILLIFILTREYKPTDMDKEVYRLGVSALEVTDDYLDAKINNKEARNRLDDIFSRLDRIDGTDSLLVKTKTFNIGTYMLLSDGMFSTSNASNVTESRNSLAEYLNKRKR